MTQDTAEISLNQVKERKLESSFQILFPKAYDTIWKSRALRFWEFIFWPGAARKRSSFALANERSLWVLVSGANTHKLCSFAEANSHRLWAAPLDV